MCGICGIVAREGRPDPQLVEGMTQRLFHRGPDGRGYFRDRRVALGHRRLKIIDLEGGDQPIFNEDRSVAIVFNGEIYNYRELRQTLADRGHALRTRSDTEVIVHLYEDFADGCVDHLNGMFSFAIWDRSRDRLLVARDRFGEKPLYWAEHRGSLYFASELKSLLFDPSIPREIDPSAIDQLLAHGYIAAPKTIYRNVFKLPPAHRLTWERGELKIERYWDVPMAPRPAMDEREAIPALRDLLEDSVRLRLRADVPVGALLSGGIDSNAVVAMASRHCTTPIHTFSVGFEEVDHNELDLARLTAERYGTEHHEIVVQARDVADLPNLIGHLDEPFADPSILPTNIITRLAANDVKVCLTGDAGDELFGGYARYRWALRDEWNEQLPAVARTILGGLSRIYPSDWRGSQRLKRFGDSRWPRYQRNFGCFDRAERLALFRPEFANRCAEDGRLFEAHRPPGDSHLDALCEFQWIDQHTYLPEDLLVKTDRISMRHSLELRIPFLDHRLVEFANTIPSGLKIENSETKSILRKALSGLLAPEILAAQKRGFGLPLQAWLSGPLRPWLEALLLADDARIHRFFQPGSIRALIDLLRSSRRRVDMRLWTLAVLEQWCRGLEGSPASRDGSP